MDYFVIIARPDFEIRAVIGDETLIERKFCRSEGLAIQEIGGYTFKSPKLRQALPKLARRPADKQASQGPQINQSCIFLPERRQSETDGL